MIVTTTHTVEGKNIVEYCGIVVGETIIGVNVFKDILGSITDIVGGRSETYEKEMSTARSLAMAEMEAHAIKRGGNAIVGVDLDYQTIGSEGSMLVVSASGTAVVLK
ncbi:hypothetical protein CS022_19070 [Veronia nyctiphanis]|uniref:UPF0145 protein CS022_19070 n=1 Tax=Veronia nyctiphanis TaxID=1278244 RepID=A0A4Q0YRY3_9GAMM|nr:heavy metal-binding domain-containing protein [Veronia nyctiphanis]RXJ71869.1 hypothetical protein CS022_19070 [Veronia nyctiphanis]